MFIKCRLTVCQNYVLLRSYKVRQFVTSAHDEEYKFKVGDSNNEQGKIRFQEDFVTNHITTTVFQKILLSVGSATVSLMDPKRADMIAVMGETAGQSAIKYMRQKMEMSAEGQDILRLRPRINSSTVDLKKLSQMPNGTLGKTYSKFLEDNRVTPDSRLTVQFVDDVDLAYVMQRYREVHDLFHTLLGMPTNMLGEVAVKWVEAIQTRLPMCIGGAVFGPLRLAPKQRQRYVKYHLPWAIQTGMSSSFLMNIFYERRWDQTIEELHQELGSKSAQKSTIRTAKLVPSQSKRHLHAKANLRKKVVEENLSDVSIGISHKANMASDSIRPTGTGTVDPMATTLLPDSHSGNTILSKDHLSLPQESSSDPAAVPLEPSSPDNGPVNTSTSSNSPSHVPVCIRIKEDRSYEVISSQKTSLAEFHVKQKLMEEQNRHRKELLGKALADRKKQTKAESQRLQQIQEELQKLDSLLSNDVSILRNQIEVASLEFSDAQKRYIKAEKEFLEAKVIMFGKLEQKELLTEHLCTIIEQNELRKARKLSELMNKLELGIVTAIPIEEKITPPTVCFMNDISDTSSNLSGITNHTPESKTEKPETQEPPCDGTDI